MMISIVEEYNQVLKSLEYGDAIRTLFDEIYANYDLDDEEIIGDIYSTLGRMGKTLSKLDEEFKVGVSNGFSIEFQLEVCRAIITQDTETLNTLTQVIIKQLKTDGKL